MLSPVSIGMGNCVRAGIPPRYITKPTRSTQPCSSLGSPTWVPALIGWGENKNVTSTGWQVALCDPIWHVSSHSGNVDCYKLLYSVPLSNLLTFCFMISCLRSRSVSVVTYAWCDVHAFVALQLLKQLLVVM